MTLQIGQVIQNRYRIDGLLGQGGFGAVYRAWDANFEIQCALKENTETSPEAQRQFMREARMLHTLRHPNLPLVKDYFLIPDQGQYLVMDYIEGKDLHEILTRRAGALPEGQVIEWLLQICAALEYLHQQNPPVIHRDIKPANIKITPEGKAVLVDFGISKLYDPELPTTQGARAMTPGFSPFEQYGHAPTDARTDIYSLGATAYTLLTGRVPTESIARVAGQELPKLASLDPAIKPEVAQAIERAMAPMPADRFASVAEFRVALLRGKTRVVPSQEKPEAFAARQPAPAKPKKAPRPAALAGERRQPVSPPRAEKPKKKRSYFWPLAALALIMVIGGLIWVRRVVLFRLWTGENPGTPAEVIHIGGRWMGHLITESPDGPMELPFTLDIEQLPGDPGFRGMVTIEFPKEGRVENHPIVEGHVMGAVVEFFDQMGLYYHADIHENNLTGFASFQCYGCEHFGDFEVFR
ncbi:MAG: serine/threonine-protein kinase [Chloroflexota bacterium]